MNYIQSSNSSMPGAGRRAYTNAGAPVGGTDAVQTLEVSDATGGSYRLSFEGRLSEEIDHDATAAEVQAILEALPNVGEGNVTVVDDEGDYPYTVTFVNALGKRVVGILDPVHINLEGESAAVEVSEETAGVNATMRGHGKGTLYVDTETGMAYVNTGTANAPVWTKIGTQT